MPLSRESRQALQVLSYWEMLELFNPQQVPKKQRLKKPTDENQCIEWSPQDPLPWHRLPEPRQFGKGRRVWQHRIYLGVYSLEDTYQHLHRYFGDDSEAYDVRPGGQSACAGLVVDYRGIIQSDSVTLSSALWAVGQIASGRVHKPDWAARFTQAAESLQEEIENSLSSDVEVAIANAPDTVVAAVAESTGVGPAMNRSEDGSGESDIPLDEAKVLEIRRLAHAVAGVDTKACKALATSTIRIQSVVVSASNSENDFDFLNSFYLDDLQYVIEQVAGGAKIPPSLASYLAPESQAEHIQRIDVMRDDPQTNAGVAIERLPYGRWPANPKHGLALRQQFAVNYALNELAAASGLFGVNGPPGTGKTTMLRDILAGNVVERASRLADLDHPTDAFTGTTHRWTAANDIKYRVRQLRPELTGFEMVFASANNAAVENITTEIPAEDAIYSTWRDQADYFSEVATAVIYGNKQSTPGEKQDRAWGMIAAKMGSKKNRTAFKSAFWFDGPAHKSGPNKGKKPPRMQSLLTQWRDKKRDCVSWKDATKHFRRAQHKVEKLVAERAAAQSRLLSDPTQPRGMEQLDQLQAQYAKATQDYQGCNEATAKARQCLDEHEKRCAKHYAEKPTLIQSVTSLGKVTGEWRETYDSMLLELARMKDDLLSLNRLRQELLGVVNDLSTQVGRLQRQQAARLKASAQYQSQKRSDQAKYDKNYPDAAWTGDQRELHTPWLDSEIDSARSELFLAALQLHQDFMANAARDVLPGLRAAVEVVSGSYPRDLEPEKIRAAWQLFFLVVPMVSTTFASFGRMFRGADQHTIGWLLIDEAGQASPQLAAGAIWRSSRVVAVGDPFQLQPVVTITEKAQRDIAAGFGVSEAWMAPVESVQTLADRVSLYGTSSQLGDRSVWVGAPLTVHRRCDEPMFSICNEIAYDNRMVNGVHRNLNDPDNPDRFDPGGQTKIYKSYWRDVPGKVAGSHVQPEEFDVLRNALRHCAQNGLTGKDIIVITPFKKVQVELSKRKSMFADVIPDAKDMVAGTIHTAQGKEADVVILILGGDPKSPGAKAWASSTVNLVNVAVSRAKRRLYVIGDRSQWGKCAYFEDVVKHLS